MLYDYDPVGNLIRYSSNNNYTVSCYYDCLNRLIKAEDNIGHINQLKLDSVGNVLSSSDALNNEVYYRYTPNGLLQKVIDPVGTCTSYEYDVMGEIISINQYGSEIDSEFSNPHRTVAQYERDVLGRVKSYKNALGDSEHFSYDINGRLINKIDRDGYETKYSYENNGLLSSINYADGKTVHYEYDALERVINITDWLGTTEICYDENSHVCNVKNFKGQEISYSWNDMDQIEALTYPDDTVVRYMYNKSGEVERIESRHGTIKYHYDSFGHIIRKEFPGEVRSEFK